VVRAVRANRGMSPRPARAPPARDARTPSAPPAPTPRARAPVPVRARAPVPGSGSGSGSGFICNERRVTSQPLRNLLRISAATATGSATGGSKTGSGVTGSGGASTSGGLARRSARRSWRCSDAQRSSARVGGAKSGSRIRRRVRSRNGGWSAVSRCGLFLELWVGHAASSPPQRQRARHAQPRRRVIRSALRSASAHGNGPARARARASGRHRRSSPVARRTFHAGSPSRPATASVRTGTPPRRPARSAAGWPRESC